MGRIQRIESRLNEIQDDITATEGSVMTSKLPNAPPPGEEDLPTTDAGRAPYQIAASQKNPLPLSLWVDQHRSDPAVKASQS